MMIIPGVWMILPDVEELTVHMGEIISILFTTVLLVEKYQIPLILPLCLKMWLLNILWNFFIDFVYFFFGRMCYYWSVNITNIAVTLIFVYIEKHIGFLFPSWSSSVTVHLIM